jgi:hypothetical protein
MEKMFQSFIVENIRTSSSQTESKKDSHICEISESFSLDAFGEILPGTLLATYPGRTIRLLDSIGCPSDSNTRAPLMDP